MPRTPLAAAMLLGGLLIAAGCNEDPAKDAKPIPEKPTPVKDGHDEHEHEHEEGHADGPHKGHLHDIGIHDYLAEIVLDKDRNLTIYILGHDDQKPVSVATDAATLTLKVDGKDTPVELQPLPQDGDEEGKTSAFQVTADKLPESVKDEHDLEGMLKVKVGDKSLDAPIEHDHDH